MVIMFEKYEVEKIPKVVAVSAEKSGSDLMAHVKTTTAYLCMNALNTVRMGAE